MIRTRWGMSEEEYDAILARGCAICGGVAACLDHCHKTGQIRGPLCGHCNIGLSRFRDDPNLLRAAILYLGELPT